MRDGVTPAAILIETYSLSVSPTLPPSRCSRSPASCSPKGTRSERLLRVFRALVGWIPGGTAVVCAVLCSFFTVFTGGSGVTILALGGVLFPALLKDGYRERFALGLLTASGSLGLLLPPALPLILYARRRADSDRGPLHRRHPAGHPADGDGGGVGRARRDRVRARDGSRSARRRRPAALWAAKWELAMPALVLVAMFSGLATAVEAAALTALYAFVVQTRDPSRPVDPARSAARRSPSA